jgi:putative peptidoglycan lipid II flippase
MVKRFLNILSSKSDGIHSAAVLLAFFAVLSQFVGLIRDRILASTFGAGQILDLYYSSFRIPDFLFIFIASAVSASVLIPLFSGKIESNYTFTKKFADSILTILSLTLVVSGSLAFFLTPYILEKLFPIQFQNVSSTLISMTRIMLLQPILLGLSNLFGSIAQASGRFFAYALAPVFYNAGIVSGILIFYPYIGIKGLAWGVVFGAALHLAVQLPAVLATGIWPRLSFEIDWPSVSKVIKLSLPRSMALSTGSLAFLVLIAIASRIGEGSVSVFNLAWNLQSVPLSIIGVSYSMAAFPTLASLLSSGKKDQFLYQLNTALRHIVFWSLPVIILFIVLRAQIVRTILGFGNFDWTDTRLTAALLAIFSLSVLAQSIVLVISRAYYAAGLTKIPFIINSFFSILIVILASVMFEIYRNSPESFLWMQNLFRVGDLNQAGVLVLPLAFSVSFILNAILILGIFSRHFNWSPILFSFVALKSLVGAIIAGLFAYTALNILSDLVNLHTVFGIFIQGFLAGIVGIFVYLAFMLLLKSQEISEIFSVATKKFKSIKVVEDNIDSQVI